MKTNFSIESIKNNIVKKHKSSTDIQTRITKKSTINTKNNTENRNDKDNFFICSHKSNFISFCENCSLDLCIECEEKHIEHKIIKFNEIIPTKEEINIINNTIKKYILDFNKLIEEIYKWKKELDKKIFYFEEKVKNNLTVNRNLEFIENFDFNKNNNYSSILKYKQFSEIITKPENEYDDNININDDNIGCYKYQNYMNAKEVLNKIENKNDDFILKSTEIVKLIFDFLTINKFQIKSNYNEDMKYLSPINTNKETFENNTYFTRQDIYKNDTYIFSNTDKKEDNTNEINNDYYNNTINENNIKKSKEKIKNIPFQKIQKYENQSKSIGNIFLEEQKQIYNSEKNSNMNYMKFKKGIIKSSTLRRLNIINQKNEKNFQSKEIFFNQKGNNESNNANYINTKLNKKLSPNNYHSNKNSEVYKYIPKIKKQNRVYTVNNTNNNLNTISSYNNINESDNKKKIYRHKKLNSVSVSNYINQSLPVGFNSLNKNRDIDNLATLDNSSGKYTNLIKPINLEAIKNTYNPNIDRRNFTSLNSINSPVYTINSLDTNKIPSSYYLIKDSNISVLNNNKRNDIKKKLLTKNTSLTHNNYNTIIETPITFSTKISTDNNTLKDHKSNNNIIEYKLNHNNNMYIVDNNENKYLVDSSKNLYVGLELGNSECRIGIVNQNNYNNIELFEFDTDNKENRYIMPTIISFDIKSNNIKIGNEAENNLLSSPSQTIFNILKIIGKSYKQINNDIDLWPFKLYYNEDLCRPYVKISYNKQKNRIFFFEDLLSIFLKKLFEIFFSKIKLINNNSNTINLILVVTVPNSYNYLQRKIIEKIFQTQIFPQNIFGNEDNIYENNMPDINNTKIKKKSNLYSGYRIILKDIKIENSSSVAAICLFNNKIKHKYVIENIFKDKNDDISNNKKYKINIISNNGEKINNNIITEINKEYKEIKERDSINSNNKQKNNSKYILVINIDGGFTNISLACITQNKIKEKNNSKIKNSKNVKKSNILEIKELSGNEFGEEDYIDVYINDFLKKFDEYVYNECLKSPNELARLRQSVLFAKKYFNSSQKDNCISITLPHKFLDLKINLNQKDYEKSCQDMYNKIISMIENILKKSKLSGKNIDTIILIGTKLTTNKIISKLKNIFINSKIIYTNCDNYIVIGATMQALNNNMIKPFYKFINITNMNFGIETLNGLMDVIISKGLKIPVQKIKYVKIKNNENNETENNHLNKYLEINIFEGDNKFVKNNRLISCANIDKRNFKEEKVGEGFIELLVEFEINNYSNLSVYVLDIKNFKRRFECLTNLDMVKG